MGKRTMKQGKSDGGGGGCHRMATHTAGMTWMTLVNEDMDEMEE